MAASGPVALGIGGVAAVLLISGIQNRSVSEVLKGSITHNDSGGGSGEGPGSSSTVGSENPVTSASPEGRPASIAGEALPPSQIAIPHTSSPSNREKELRYGLDLGLKYKEELQDKVNKKELTLKQANAKFYAKYPWYVTWARELRELLNTGK